MEKFYKLEGWKSIFNKDRNIKNLISQISLSVLCVLVPSISNWEESKTDIEKINNNHKGNIEKPIISPIKNLPLSSKVIKT